MASEYKDKSTELDQSSGGIGTSLGQSLNKTTSTGSSGNTTPKASPATSIYGQKINQMANNSPLQYTPGDSVTAAKNYLDGIIAAKPGAYKSKYTSQVASIYDGIMARQKFQYDMNSDAVYQAYQQRYMQQGKQAMRDTTGQAAAQTGGYGNSYAATAGYGAYQGAMNQLNDQAVQLQRDAVNNYNAETERMQNLYGVASQAEQTDYQRYQQQYADWQNDRTYAANQYQQAYNNDYTMHQNNIGMAQTIQGWERDDALQAQNQAQSYAQELINAGIMPSEDLIKQSGWDTADVKALVKKHK